jgi:hypothetical protein
VVAVPCRFDEIAVQRSLPPPTAGRCGPLDTT